MRHALFQLAFFVVLLAPNPAPARGLTTGADFLKVAPGARPDAMGQAFSALADDVNAFHYNPAGLGLIRMPEAGYSRYEFVAGIHFDFLAVAIPLGKPGVAGLAFQGLGVEPFNSTADPDAVRADASEKMILLGWGRSFGRIQAGASVKKVRRDLDGWKRGGVGVDLGLRWIPLRRLSVAAALSDLGPTFEPARGALYPATWRAGAAFRVLEQERHQADAAFDATFDQVTQELRCGAGGEYWYRGFCALRAGWAFDTLDSQQEGAAFGAGLRWRGYGLDYSIHPFASLGMTHRFSGSFRWEGPWVVDVEPSPPLRFKVFASDTEVRAEWTVPRGFAGDVEVVRIEMSDGREEVFGPFTRPPVFLDGSMPGAFYKAYARAVGGGGRRSLPSNEAYYSVSAPSAVAETVEIPLPPTATPLPVTPTPVPARVKKKVEPPLPEPQIIQGKLDPMGLRLQWNPLMGIDIEGYQLYRKSPDGLTERLNHRHLQGTRIWVPKEKVSAGILFLVTALRPDGTELIIGVHTCKAPDEWEDTRAYPAAIPLKMTGVKEGAPRLEWEPGPKTASCLVLYADPRDRIYQVLGETKGADEKALLELLKDVGDSIIVLVAQDKKGIWVSRTQEREWEGTAGDH